MSLQERIEKDFIIAYKAKSDDRTAALRMLKAAVKLKQVDLKRPLSDDEILDVITRQVKQRLDSIEQFRAGNRPELADKEEREMVILREYLPVQLTDQEMDAVIEDAIGNLGASKPGEMGRVIQAVMKDYKGRVDGKKLSDAVKLKLSK